HGAQRELAAVEAGKALSNGHADELTAQAIRPTVIRAGDRARTPTAAVEDPRRPVAAHVVEGLNLPLRAAHRDHALWAQVERRVIPGSRDGVHMTDDLPAGL